MAGVQAIYDIRRGSLRGAGLEGATNRMKIIALCFVAIPLGIPAIDADPLVLDLWPAKPPGDAGIAGEERFFQLMPDGKIHEVGGRPTTWKTNVTRPQILVYRAPKAKDTGVTMVICPGGGYHN